MKKATKKRLICIILVLCLTITPMFSITASAGIFDSFMDIVKTVTDLVDEGKKIYDQAMGYYDEGKKILNEVEKFAADPITYILSYGKNETEKEKSATPDKNVANSKYYAIYVGKTQRLGYNGRIVQDADYKDGKKVPNSDYYKLEDNHFNYYIKDAKSNAGKPDGKDWTARFDPETCTLYLQGYDGGPIGFMSYAEIPGLNSKKEENNTQKIKRPQIVDKPLDRPLTIVLIGNNKIRENVGSNTKDGVGICHVGQVIITSTTGGTLTITTEVTRGINKDAFGIVAAAVSITGNADVTVNVTGPNVATGIRAFGTPRTEGNISVGANTKLTVNATNVGDGSGAHANGLQADKTIIFGNNANAATITCSAEKTGKTNPIYTESHAEIRFLQRNLVTLRWDKGKGAAMYGDPAVILDTRRDIQIRDFSTADKPYKEYRGAVVHVPDVVNDIVIENIELPTPTGQESRALHWRVAYNNTHQGKPYDLYREFFFEDMNSASSVYMEPGMTYLMSIRIHIRNEKAVFDEFDKVKITAKAVNGITLQEVSRELTYPNQITVVYKYTLPGTRNKLSVNYKPAEHDIKGGKVNEKLEEAGGARLDTVVRGGSGRYSYEVLGTEQGGRRLPDWLETYSGDNGTFIIRAIEKYWVPDMMGWYKMPEIPYAAQKATIRATDIVTGESIDFTINIGAITATGFHFITDTAFDVPKGAADTAITSINVSTGVKNALAGSATYSKISGPSWLSISSSGRITGTRPSTAQNETTMVISVRGRSTSVGSITERRITIRVGEVFVAETNAITPPNDNPTPQPTTEPSTQPSTQAPTQPTTQPTTEPTTTAPPASNGLTFTKQSSYDIPSGSRYQAISSINVSGGVSGGSGGYKFYKVSGPTWLNVNENTGVLSGSRQGAAPATTAVIQVKDSSGATATITINVGEVK